MDSAVIEADIPPRPPSPRPPTGRGHGCSLAWPFCADDLGGGAGGEAVSASRGRAPRAEPSLARSLECEGASSRPDGLTSAAGSDVFSVPSSPRE